jgi:two-component system, LytTR family, response regulator
VREIRALIADDEPLARRGIRQLLEHHKDVTVVGEARDGRETLRALDSLVPPPDLVFLDVQMPSLDGFGVLRAHGPERMPEVVFVTAYDEFAVRAFETHAVDYLVKPVNEARFVATLDRVRERLRARDAVALTERLLAVLSAHDEAAVARLVDTLQQPPSSGETRPARRLVVPTGTGDLVLDDDEIDWIEADDYYAAVHARGRRHLIRMSLSTLEEKLDAQRFVRVHRSAIVRLDRVRALQHGAEGDVHVVLRDGTRLPVSRRRRERVSAMVRALGV